MGAVKRTHKYAREKQLFHKFVRRFPDRYEQILRDICKELIPFMTDIVKGLTDLLIDAYKAEQENRIINGESTEEPTGIPSLNEMTVGNIHEKRGGE